MPIQRPSSESTKLLMLYDASSVSRRSSAVATSTLHRLDRGVTALRTSTVNPFSTRFTSSSSNESGRAK